jgi:hypothetical protein
MLSWVTHNITQVQKWPSSSKVSETSETDIGRDYQWKMIMLAE